MASSVYDVIDSLDIGRDWKLTFKKIHITYYKNYINGKTMYPIFWTPACELVDLSFLNSLKMYSWFNPLGLIFGPFYYVFKGLYKKGIIMLILLLLLFYGNDVTKVMSIFIFIYCAFFINIDYFEKMVLNHPEVVSNPLIIGDDFNEQVLAKLLTTRTSPIPYIFLIMLLMSPCYLGIAKTRMNSESLKYLVSEPEKICKDKKECTDLVKDYFQKINETKDSYLVSELYYNIAHAYFSIDDQMNSIKSLDSAIMFDKDNINAYLLRAKLYVKMGNNVQALLDYKEALKINPKATFLNYYIGYNYYALGKYEEALEHFETVTRIHEEASYFEAQAYTRKMLNDIQGATKDIKKAITLYEKAKNKSKVEKLNAYLKSIQK